MELWARATTGNNVVSDTIQIGVLPLPEVMILPAQAIIDPGTEVELTASGATSYLWSNGSTGPSITVAPRQTTEYWALGTDMNGCKQSDTARIEVVFTTEVDFTYNAVCAGDTALLIAHITTNDSVVETGWDVRGDGLFQDGSNDSLYLAMPAAGEKLVGLRVKTFSGAIHTQYHSVPAAAFPQAKIVVDGYCFGQPTVFTDASVSSSGSIETRYWSVGDGNEFNEQSFSYEYIQTGDYEVMLIVTNTFGCADTAQNTITISNPPLIDLRLADGSLVAEGQTINIPSGGSATFSVENNYDSIFGLALYPLQASR